MVQDTREMQYAKLQCAITLFSCRHFQDIAAKSYQEVLLHLGISIKGYGDDCIMRVFGDKVMYVEGNEVAVLTDIIRTEYKTQLLEDMDNG